LPHGGSFYHKKVSAVALPGVNLRKPTSGEIRYFKNMPLDGWRVAVLCFRQKGYYGFRRFSMKIQYLVLLPVVFGLGQADLAVAQDLEPEGFGRPVTERQSTIAQKQDVSAKFFTLTLGLPVGYNIKRGNVDSGYNVGIGFASFDNLTIGVDVFSLYNDDQNTSFGVLRLSYNVWNFLGAAIGIGSPEKDDFRLGIGVLAELFKSKRSFVSNNLQIRLDYITLAKSIGEGSLMLTAGFKFGL
jgi:hypothetical protein